MILLKWIGNFPFASVSTFFTFKLTLHLPNQYYDREINNSSVI
jgi:hypothetical protein